MKRNKRTSKKLKNLLIYLCNSECFLKTMCAVLMIASVFEVFNTFIFGDKSIFTIIAILLIVIFSEFLVICITIKETDKEIIRKNKLRYVLFSKRNPIFLTFIILIVIIDCIINDTVFYYFKLGSGAVNFFIRAFTFINILVIFIFLEEKILKKINKKYSKRLKE